MVSQNKILKRRWSRGGDLQFFLEMLDNIPETILGQKTSV